MTIESQFESQLESRLKLRLAERRKQQLYRERQVCNKYNASLEITPDDSYSSSHSPIISFSSNDYLGLTHHPEMIAAVQSAVERYGVGCGASQLIDGHCQLHHDLEEALAAFTGRSRALLFATGYMANVGVLSALFGRGDVIFADRLNHASLVDGARLSGATLHRYRHGDVVNLAKVIDRFNNYRQAIIVSDGVFSVDGDVTPVKELAILAKQYGLPLMVDDAHGFGVLGPDGKGTLAAAGLTQEGVPILMAGFGKGFGSFGAFIAGSEALIESLIQFARSYVYTTAMPPAVVAANHAALKIIQKENWRRDYLQCLICRFKQGAAQLGLSLMPSDTAIQPLLIGDSAKALSCSEALYQKGFLVYPLRPPTVPPRTARLRIALSVSHREEDVDRLLEVLGRVVLNASFFERNM